MRNQVPLSLGLARHAAGVERECGGLGARPDPPHRTWPLAGYPPRLGRAGDACAGGMRLL